MDRLKEVFGERLLHFLLARNASEEALSPVQQATESLLAELAEPGNPKDPEYFSNANLGYHLSHYLPDNKTTLAWMLHIQSGGNLYEIEHEEPLEQHLLVLARDFWPALILPIPEGGPFGLRGPSTFSHPASRALMQFLLADRAIRELFPGAPDTPNDTDILGINSDVVFSSGHGGGFQLSTLPDILLMNARARQFVDGNPYDLADFLIQILKILDEARRLARGEEVMVPKLVGLTNMDMPSDAEVHMPFGKLRSPRAHDEQILPKSSFTGGRLTAVLETTQPLKILSKLPPEEVPLDYLSTYDRLTPLFEQYHAQGERNLMLVRYSVLLASTDTLFAPVQLSQAIFEPLQQGLGQSWAPFVGQPSGISTLDVDTTERVLSWAEKVNKHHPENLNLGVRRLLSAAGVRLDPIDGFIDAVVCWENMFGSTTESTFRICGAMACLLEPSDRTKRLTMFNALKKLYEARSQVVHGAKELSATVSHEHRTQAVQRALEAMRRLYDYPGLLNAKGSAERGRDALLSMGVDANIELANEVESISPK